MIMTVYHLPFRIFVQEITNNLQRTEEETLYKRRCFLKESAPFYVLKGEETIFLEIGTDVFLS
jgi:hypothetical protein